MYFSRASLCFIYFDVIIRLRLKKKFRLAELFFSRANEVNICGLVQQLILGMFIDLTLQCNIIALFILGLKTSNNLQQFKCKNDIKQYFIEILKN